MKYKRTKPIVELMKVETFPEAIVLFSFKYSYSLKYIANKINMPKSTFTNKLKMNRFTVNEEISINNFIKERIR